MLKYMLEVRHKVLDELIERAEGEISLSLNLKPFSDLPKNVWIAIVTAFAFLDLESK
jgi:hypothetical protein